MGSDGRALPQKKRKTGIKCEDTLMPVVFYGYLTIQFKSHTFKGNKIKYTIPFSIILHTFLSFKKIKFYPLKFVIFYNVSNKGNYVFFVGYPLKFVIFYNTYIGTS